VWEGALSWCNNNFFYAKVRCEDFANFHSFTVRHHNSMRNRLFGLPGRIKCEQSPSCQRKLWACCWHESSLVSHIFILYIYLLKFRAIINFLHRYT
jgi:hypothetical protein